MAWKPIDFVCPNCGRTHEEFVKVPLGQPRPESGVFTCPHCGEESEHVSVLGLPAPYMGEKVLNPRMYGGAYDTMGHVERLPLPDLPGQAEHSDTIRKNLAALPADASSQDRRAAIKEANKDAPSSADYSAMFEKPEYKEVEAINKKIDTENAQKKKRAQAIAKGENVNMRRDKCAGDPNVTA